MEQLTNRQLQALETKNKLMDAALLVFSKKGYSASSTKDIAKEAGVTDGLIYHYFKSKEELLWAVIDKHTLIHDINRLAAESNADEPLEAVLFRMIDSLFEVLHLKADLIVMFFGESQRNAAVRARLSELIQQGAHIFYRLLSERIDAEEGYLKIAIRNLLTSLVMYFLTHDRFMKDNIQRKAYTKITVHQFLRILQ